MLLSLNLLIYLFHIYMTTFVSCKLPPALLSPSWHQQWLFIGHPSVCKRLQCFSLITQTAQMSSCTPLKPHSSPIGSTSWPFIKLKTSIILMQKTTVATINVSNQIDIDFWFWFTVNQIIPLKSKIKKPCHDLVYYTFLIKWKYGWRKVSQQDGETI